MIILGIETSCDETAASIVEDGRWIHSNIVASSLKEHARYGGVIPEIASRRQLELIHMVVLDALEKASMSWDDIDAIAVTKNPGLVGSLLVGISFARSLAFALNKPLIEVNHIEAHLYANFLAPKGSEDPLPQLPAVGLVASGGHTSLYFVEDFNQLELLGTTRDDAVGEAFDKVARILDLGYPGGPVIDRLAKESSSGDIKFKCAEFKDSFDFSFSGIKTGVLYHHQKNSDSSDYSVGQVASAFQESVVSVLVKKCVEACKAKKVNTLLVGGGVAANSALRTLLKDLEQQDVASVFFPPMPLCMDNAAMIAGLGYVNFQGN